MIQDEELLNKIKNYKGEYISTGELLKLGLNHYYISRLENEKFLEKVGRGTYKLKVENKEMDEETRLREQYRLFNSFKFNVLSNNYAKAYHNLLENIKLQNSHDNDNNYRVYLILLKEILGSKYDFSVLNDLYEYTDQKNDSYYNDYILFREAVMDSDFHMAKRYLQLFTENEKERRGHNSISTELFNSLLNEVLRLKEQSKERESNRLLKLKNYLKKYVYFLKTEKYKEAIDNLEYAIFYADNPIVLRNLRLYKIIVEDIDYLVDSNKTLDFKEVDYSKADSTYAKLFWSIQSKDYENSLLFLEELLYINDKKYLKNLKFLVDKVLYYNTKNKMNNKRNLSDRNSINANAECMKIHKNFIAFFEDENYEEALNCLKIKVDFEYAKEQKDNDYKLINIIIHYLKMKKEKLGFEEKEIDYSSCKNDIEKFNAALNNEDYRAALKLIGKITYNNDSKNLGYYKKILHLMLDLDKKYHIVPKKEVIKEEIQSKETIIKEEQKIIETKEEIEVTDELVYNYVYDRKYDEIFKLLINKKNSLENLSRIEHFSLALISILKNVERNKYEYEEHSYRNPEIDTLKRIYEAISAKDIDEIKRCVEKNFKLVKDTFEVEIFKMIIDDIIETRKNVEEQALNSEKRKLKLKEITNIVNDKINLTNEEIDKLFELFNFLIETEKNTYLHVLCTNILYYIDMANNSSLDDSYFKTIDCDEKDVDKQFVFYLSNGDFLSALKIIKYVDFNKILKQYYFEDKLILKKLLYILGRALNKPFIKSKKELEIDFDLEYQEQLKELKHAVKKRDFYKAFNYYINNINNKKLCDDLAGDLLILYMDAINEEKELYSECEEAIKNNKDCRLKFNNYLEYVQRSSIQENEKVKKRKLEIEKKLMDL